MNIRQTKAIQELVENGGSVGAAMRKAGYSPKTALNPKKLTETKAFKETVDPFIESLKKERDRIVSALSRKDLDEVQYQHLTSAVDTLTKNIQLLGGKETEKMGVTINVMNYGG
jgi:hypothetical protein